MQCALVKFLRAGVTWLAHNSISRAASRTSTFKAGKPCRAHRTCRKALENGACISNKASRAGQLLLKLSTWCSVVAVIDVECICICRLFAIDWAQLTCSARCAVFHAASITCSDVCALSTSGTLQWVCDSWWAVVISRAFRASSSTEVLANRTQV